MCFDFDHCNHFVQVYYFIVTANFRKYSDVYQARQTRPNSGGVAEGHPRFDKGGGLQYFFYFLRVENRTF